MEALAQISSDSRFSLRYVLKNPGNLAVGLVVRHDAESREKAKSRLHQALESIAGYFQVRLKGQAFESVTDEDELDLLLSPFRVGEVVEIVRNTAIIPLAKWVESEKVNIGFLQVPAQPSVRKQVEDEDAVYHVLPFIPTEGSLRQLCESMLSQEKPCMVDFFLQSYRPGSELENLEQSIARCEDYLNRTAPRKGTQETIFAARAKMLRDWLVVQKESLSASSNAFILRVRVVSPGPVNYALVTMVGQSLTKPFTVSPNQPPYFAGGFRYIPRTKGDPVYKGEPLAKLADEREHEVDRLHFVYDLNAAGSVFRLPVADSVHFPGIQVRSPLLEPPENLPPDGTLLGWATRRCISHEVRLKTDDHRRHAYMIGQTGVGKTSLVLTMAMDNIRNGQGVAILDPHGDLINQVLSRLPRKRIEDVILFDPGDGERPVGLNLLEWETEEQKAFLVDEMLEILHLLYLREEVGPVFWRNVRMSLLLLMSNSRDPGTLVQVPFLFTNPKFHHRWLGHVNDPLVADFWNNEFSKSDYHRDTYLTYVVSKFDPFITHPLMRNILGQHKSGFSVEQVMNEGKILLVNLAKGKLGEANSRLLGMILIAKMYAATMRRISRPKKERKDFYVYVDEFQNLATKTFSFILSEARKFRLNLTLCNQYVAQLSKEITDAIFGNVGTMVVFRTGIQDAEVLARHFPNLPQEALASQPNYHAYIRLLVQGFLSPPFSIEVRQEPAPDLEKSERMRKDAFAMSRLRYGRDRSLVTSDIASSVDVEGGGS